MSSIYIIAEAHLDVFTRPAGQQWCGYPAGQLVQTAVNLSKSGIRPIMLTEAASDPTGDLVMKYMEDNGLDISCADRYTEGKTPVLVHVGDKVSEYTDYRTESGLDITWPRIERGDTVIYGGYAALTQRWSATLAQFLEYATLRGALAIYVPGDASRRCNRATRVMPQFFENLERASVTLLTPGASRFFCNTDDDTTAFTQSISFHCPSVISITATGPKMLGNIITTPQLQAITGNIYIGD